MRESHSIFTAETTDSVFYDALLKGKQVFDRNIEVIGTVVEMTPYEYLNKCCEIQEIPDIEELIRTCICENNIKGLLSYMKFNPFPLPYINYVSNNQEGRHRAVIAKRLGYKRMPVMIVTKKFP